MTESDAKAPNTRQAPRAPIETKVHLEFEKFSGFITEYSSNISEGGMFIKTTSPKPLGTVLSFEFKLADNFKIIQGLGEVVWSRVENLSAEKPAGMGIRFVDIDQQSRELIATMVHNYIKRGGKPFQLENEHLPSEQEPLKQEGPPSADPMLDAQDLFAMTDDPTEAITPPPDQGTNESTASPVEADFQALFDISDESIALPDNPPAAKQESPEPKVATIPSPPPPATKSPSEQEGLAPNLVTQDEPTPPPASSSAPIVDLLEPEPEPKRAKPKPVIRRRRKAMKINGPVGIIVAAALGMGSAIYFRTQMTGFIFQFIDMPGQKEETAVRPKPRIKPTIAPTQAPTIPVEKLPPSTGAKAVTEPTALATPQPMATPTIIPTATPKPVAKVEVTPFASLQNISWEKTARGLLLILSANAPFPEGSYSTIHVAQGSPREVIKLHGIQKPFSKARMAINTPEVRRIRIGFHALPTGNELHIVADLGNPDVKVKRIDSDGRNLRIYLEK